jgi:hypothetical protein
MKSHAMSGRLAWAAIAAVHFGLSNLILPLTTTLAKQASVAADGPGIALMLLVRATKLLHFPIVTLALYPREWFPGDWVYLPMAANSLIWGFGISWLIGRFRKAR